MSLTLTLAVTSPAPLIANSAINGVLTVVNNGANPVVVQTVGLSEVTNMGVKFRQPDFLTPNVAPGVGNPTIAAAGTANYPFAFVCAPVNTPGDSPQAPGGPAPTPTIPTNSSPIISCVVVSYDSVAGVNVVGSTQLAPVPLAASVAPSPPPLGGALQFNVGGANAVNWFFFA